MVQAENSMQGSDFSRVTSRISAKTLAMVMGENIPYFQEEIGSAGLDGIVSRMTFELLTSMNLQDPRTFLGRELPMYALFDSEIDVASADVDYTSIPIESAPPPELEKEIIKAMEKPDQDRASTTQSGIKQKKVLIYSTHFWESYLPELGEKIRRKHRISKKHHPRFSTSGPSAREDGHRGGHGGTEIHLGFGSVQAIEENGAIRNGAA